MCAKIFCFVFIETKVDTFKNALVWSGPMGSCDSIFLSLEPWTSAKTPQKIRILKTFDPRLAGFNLQLLLRQKGLFAIHRAVASQEMVSEKKKSRSGRSQGILF